MFERYEGGDNAVLVHVDFTANGSSEDHNEFIDLVTSTGATVCEVFRTSRHRPDPKGYVGSGKLDEIKAAVAAHQADIVIFNHELSPAQERNIERHVCCRVIDRTSLILDIFASRAQSFEGKLQVELAQLRHMSTRLIRGWTHLERQKGGIGLRGPGETQLETDRRLLRGRIAHILKRLEKVHRQREQGRRSRARSATPTVALVGYTNAGKSTLFNQLTEGQVYAADQLFATLDPTLRKVMTKTGKHFVIADTVGFIRQLPHELVAAFRSTLQETREADLLLHVIDAAHEEKEECAHQVMVVLKEIGADEVPMIEVYNKIDQLDGAQPRVDIDEEGRPRRVWVSAHTGDGLEALIDTVHRELHQKMLECSIIFGPERAALRSALYQRKCVLNEDIDELGNFKLSIQIDEQEWYALGRDLGVDLDALVVTSKP